MSFLQALPSLCPRDWSFDSLHLKAISEDEFEYQLQRYSDAIDIINNWRAAHSQPMLAFRLTLQNRAKKIDRDALIAQRLKRLSSIKAKLERFSGMKLSRMQDIGGCRAILGSVQGVGRLAARYESDDLLSNLVDKKDYIASPKPDGYRGIHLVYKYLSNSQRNLQYNGLQVELQLRSRLQHAWATAVETVSTFTGQGLKASSGDVVWKRFFCHMGSAIASREQEPWVPGTPQSHGALITELRQLARELKVSTLLSGWRAAMTRMSPEKGTIFLLELDTQKRVVRTRGFQKKELKVATEQYSLVEKDIASNPHKQAVLVSVSSVKALQRAYPNYFADTEEFLVALHLALDSV